MKKKFIYILTVVNLFLLSGTIPAFSQTYTFKTYSIQDGLSQSVVQAMIQSKDGFIWIGTGYGLSRFDGIAFKNYFTDQGLIQNRIYALWQDKTGDIWIGTQRGISIYNGKKFKAPDYHLNRILNTPVDVIKGDANGRIWIATEGQGVFYIKNDSLHHLTKKNGLASDRVRSIIIGKNGRVWFGTRNGMNGLLPNGKIVTYTVKNGLVDNHIRDICRGKDGSLWIGTRNGLSYFNSGYFTNFTTKNGLVYNQIRCLLLSKNGDLWIGTEDGLSRFRDGKFDNYTVANGLNNNNINSIMQDSEGNLWLGTYGGGMCRFTGERFTNYTIKDGLNNNIVTSMKQLSNGNLFVGTYGGGINVLHNQQINHITTKDGLVDDRIYSFSKMKDGSIWIATHDGISVYQNGKIRKSPLPKLPYQKIRCILRDTSGRYWIGTDDEGVLIVHGKKVRKFQKKNGLIGNNVRCIHQTKDGDVWIGTLEGITRYHNGQYTNYTAGQGLIHSGVLYIYQDHEGNIWFATYGGLSRFDHGRFHNFSIKNGLRNSVCYTITQDKSGDYWVGTNKGILKINPNILLSSEKKITNLNNSNIRRYTANMGLVSNEMNWNAIYKDTSGNIWFGSVGGLIKVDPSLVKPDPIGPPVYISNVQVMGKNWNRSKKISVAYNQNFVTIHYVGLCFSTPEMVKYEYRLKGVDQHWVTTTKRSVRYSALTDGDYVFQVRARNNDGVWSPKVASIDFVIQPPIWESWWFIASLVVIILIIIALIYNNLRIGRLVDIERMRVRIASDLHDDVGSSLTEIALQTDFLLADKSSDDFSDSIKQLGEQSRKIVSTMDDIVWSIDARNDTLGDLTDRMQDYANSVLPRKQIMVKYDFRDIENEHQHNLSVDLRQNLYLIFKEAINNIAKHSDASKVDVSLTRTDSHFVMIIRDNGKGIGSKEKLTGHGLKNMKMRAKRIDAKLEFLADNGFAVRVTGKGL
ncbi:MAG TPA: two-component regulator propeller domain-containing protein [Balneolales bacterium]|nr:two-component regulator propeller domain-containing protein [Balneolales bacterium]